MFWIVAGVVVTLVGSVGTWVAIIVSNPKRRLLYGVRANVPVMTAPEGLRTDLKLFHRDEQLTEPRLVEIQLVGRGRRDISSDLLANQPIRLSVGPRIIRVLDVSSNESSRRLPEITPDGTALTIGPTVVGNDSRSSSPCSPTGPNPTSTGSTHYPTSRSDPSRTTNCPRRGPPRSRSS